MSPGFPFQSIFIYGMGLMGASVALAVRAAPGFRGRISGAVRSERSARLILEQRISDEVFLGDEAALAAVKDGGYDLVILGLPVRNVIGTIAGFPAHAGIITDMSSTRVQVHKAAALRPDLVSQGRIPCADPENAGPGAAKADLFKGRLCIVTGVVNKEDGEAVASFWKALGMAVTAMDASDHDAVMAFLSHGPHILSGLMTVWAADDARVGEVVARSPLPVTGGGFRDMARIAGSNPEMWTDILATNRGSVAKALRDYRVALDQAIEMVESPDVEAWPAWFQRARLARNRLCGYPEND